MTELMLQERQGLIMERLRRDGRVLAGPLASEFGVSEDTIRRDLRDMAAAGLCERVYGGALPLTKAKTSLKERLNLHIDRKRILASAMADTILPRSLIFFDAGSTNLAIAEALPESLSLTAVTNSPAIAQCLMEKPEVETILIGGTLNRMVGGSVGAQAITALEDMTPDLCLIGTCGLGEGGELSVYDQDDAAFKRAAIRRSRQVAVAVTAEKFGLSAPFTIARIGQYHRLVVEAGIEPSRLSAIRESGCEIITAAPQKSRE